MSRVVRPVKLGRARAGKVSRMFISACSSTNFPVLRGPNVAGCSFCKGPISWAASLAKLRTKRQNKLYKPWKGLSFVSDVGL